MKLIWFKRADGLWNADCACGAACCGVPFHERKEFEDWHFGRASEERESNWTKNNGGPRPPCGAKFPEEDINHPEPKEFA